MPFAPEGKRALEQSLREALALRDRHIGARRVLLARVLADPAFLAVRLLGTRHGVDMPALRRSVLDTRARRAGRPPAALDAPDDWYRPARMRPGASDGVRAPT